MNQSRQHPQQYLPSRSPGTGYRCAARLFRTLNIVIAAVDALWMPEDVP